MMHRCRGLSYCAAPPPLRAAFALRELICASRDGALELPASRQPARQSDLIRAGGATQASPPSAPRGLWHHHIPRDFLRLAVVYFLAPTLASQAAAVRE